MLHTAHGDVETPFVGIAGTPGDSNGVSPAELAALGTRVLTTSTYQLLVRPGVDIVRQHGGLHQWLVWDGPLLADNGRSLPPTARLLRVDNDGLTFASHIDGSRFRLTPESCIAAHEALGADIGLALDPPDADRDAERTERWAKRSLEARTRSDQALFVVVSTSAMARTLGGLPFDGLALHVNSNGNAISACVPEHWPRYWQGGAGLTELFDGIQQGADQLDWTDATRLAHVGQLYTPDGLLDITLEPSSDDSGPIQAGCGCSACTTGFARRYVRHLFAANELLGPTLASMHNLWFVQAVLESVRKAIRVDALADFRASFMNRYGSA
ncbi:MAG TPA: tRNA guanosine(34) transglycosylase Tgt [Chloroflexota bacterium]|nr:tRNA guanosine(34) transglycosylase Tgt [Chloroflexota bacterium]